MQFRGFLQWPSSNHSPEIHCIFRGKGGGLNSLTPALVKYICSITSLPPQKKNHSLFTCILFKRENFSISWFFIPGSTYNSYKLALEKTVEVLEIVIELDKNRYFFFYKRKLNKTKLFDISCFMLFI